MPTEVVNHTLTPVFTAAEAQDAFERWGMNCGPSALAAVCGLMPDAVRPYLVGFDEKRYTNPTMMFSALSALFDEGRHVRSWKVKVFGVRNRVRDGWPKFGLARVQWEGPWMAPDVPIKARYRQTHWIGAQIIELPNLPDQVRIFDVNAMQVGGVIPLATWIDRLVPWLTKNYVPRGDGGWHLTHAIEVER